MKNEPKYIHNTNDHNMRASSIVVPILIEKLNANFNVSKLNSVVDVGCGLGTWLKKFEELDFDILGIDGAHLNQDLLVIEKEKVLIKDFEEEIKIQTKFDLCISLEVAEHISHNNAKQFIESLTNLADIVVFAAAIPYQGGQNHINEQWATYWINIFNSFGYEIYDLIRPEIFNNSMVDWWYKQNMFVAVKKNILKKDNILLPEVNRFDNFITKELWDLKMKYIEDIEKGKMSFPYYIKRIYNKLFL